MGKCCIRMNLSEERYREIFGHSSAEARQLARETQAPKPPPKEQACFFTPVDIYRNKFNRGLGCWDEDRANHNANLRRVNEQRAREGRPPLEKSG